MDRLTLSSILGGILGAAAMLLVACTSPSISLTDTEDSYTTKQVMLDTTVRIRTERTMGSGIIVDRKVHGAGVWEYRLVTNAHVVGSNESVAIDLRSDVTRTGKVIAVDRERDLALVTFYEHTDKLTIAPILSVFAEDKLAIFDRVYAVGSGLGYNPGFPSVGIVASLKHCFKAPDGTVKDGDCYVQASTPIAPGNSGGGLWRWSKPRARYELVGVTSAVSVVYGLPVWHMSLSIPHGDLLKFLAKAVDKAGPST